MATYIGDKTGAALAINDSGVIGGFMEERSDLGYDMFPFIYENGVVMRLPTLGISPSGNSVTSINNSGLVAGVVTSASYPEAKWSAAKWVNGEILLLPPPTGFRSSYANDVNDAGQIVGDVSIDEAPWTMHPVLWENGIVHDLGSPGGLYVRANDINSKGQIVGYGEVASGELAAFLYESGTMKNLTTLLGASTGSNFWSAGSINDQGQITGGGIPPGVPPPEPGKPPSELHGFLLTPLNPEQVIDQLIARIDSYGIDPGIAKSLKAKLSNARDAVLHGDVNSACNLLKAFKNEVQAQSGRKLTSQQAAELVAKAEKIRSMLGC